MIFGPLLLIARAPALARFRVPVGLESRVCRPIGCRGWAETGISHIRPSVRRAPRACQCRDLAALPSRVTDNTGHLTKNGVGSHQHDDASGSAAASGVSLRRVRGAGSSHRSTDSGEQGDPLGLLRSLGGRACFGAQRKNRLAGPSR